MPNWQRRCALARGSFAMSGATEKETMSVRKLVVGAFVTLASVMQAPGGADEDRDGGFEHGG